MQAIEAQALIADSDPHLRDVLARALEAAGYAVLRAAEGDEALDAARRALPEVVVMNAELSGQSGWLVCVKLTFAEPAPSVLLYTADPRAANRDYARYAGAEAVFEHADDAEQLALEVRSAIGRIGQPAARLNGCARATRRAS